MTQIVKKSYTFNDTKQRKIALSCSKKPPVLLRGIINGDFYCLNCLHSFRTKNKLESHKEIFENKDFCKVIMPSEDKILEFNQYQKSNKATSIICADPECFIEKTDACKNNSENSSTTKTGEHIPSGFSMSKLSSFKNIEHNHDAYRGKDCMEKLGESLKEYAMKYTLEEQQELYENAKICNICKQKTFTVPIQKKVTRINKNGKEITKNVTVCYYHASYKF